jgi:enoyl-CoA hydratase/carnithine racemase
MTISIERSGAVATVTIDKAEEGNRLDVATVRALTERLLELQDGDSPADVVILAGAGDDFSLGRRAAVHEPPTPNKLMAEFGTLQRLNEVVQRYPAVTIAKVQGRARGAALSLAGRCDLAIAAEDALLSFPEVRHGIPPTIVLSHYRYVLPRPVIFDLVLTGREISGAEGVAAGLMARAVPRDDLDRIVAELATEIAGYGSRTLRTIKRFMGTTDGMDPRDAPNYGISVISAEMIDRRLSGES